MGINPTKFHEFIAQCLLTFQVEPHHYSRDKARVTFTTLYLTEAVVAWFQPFLLHSQNSPLLQDWDLFTGELNMMFGDLNISSTSGWKLLNLHMRGNHLISCYIVDFMKHSTDTGWDDATLAHTFYQGLPDCIKDELVHLGG